MTSLWRWLHLHRIF